MNLPGFTAQGSLYRASGRYRTAGARGRIDRTVTPAQSARGGPGSYFQTVKKTCQPGTQSCTPDPADPSCQNCTFYYDEDCNALLWHKCDPWPIQCAPLTVCNPDPLNPFCDICTTTDENCRKTNAQVCLGVKIPEKIPLNSLNF